MVNRRRAMLGSMCAGAGLLLPRRGSAGAATTAAAGARCSTPRDAVASTQYGPVRGYVEDGVYIFKGVPYGADTGGENRWLPAKAPARWTDPYPALAYGANSPQTLHDFRAREHTFLQQWTDGFLGEDMLKLNIWTPALSGNRPVMVYFHGGGFSFGSSYELASHDGAQMARHHDVVQVSINHRLNVLGFLDLTEVGGSAYAESVNVSMTDCIAALRWVQENIARFGGNPDKVMIYGQSGGGSKVTTLLGMPSGKGMIHRAAVQSGGGGALPSAEQSREFGRRVVRELGIGPRDIAALQRMEWKPLFEAGNKVADAMNGPRPAMGPALTPRVGWNPTLDGEVITVASFSAVAPEVSRNVPLLIGNTSEEGMRWGYDPSEARWRADLSAQMGSAKADRLIAAMKKAHPEKATRTLAYGVQGLMNRNRVQDMVRLKHAQGGAPVYQYLFQWQSPQLGGVAGAWHTAELAFCFDNTALCAQGTGNTPGAQRLARTMATAWATFARTGNPSHSGLAWAATDPHRCQTMVFDETCRMVDDPEGEARRILLS
ncbi:carboxylesterase/lipase family protein [Sphingomonas desiccabilis]|uniref:Carboxylic ester hydrolase n=1 Tax=Sphingomonas desiccabilis TaxID=429134 RepID=A0A4Q2J2D4_9SPHN|nr:carboxylesterase family protein [Sphingomonas desiccabilis]MBB3910956.1 para-nitrobenzyl esterase [Sphingomonas desiccabilis]RXZ35542.1 carboxylesterase/lipase family protein [Sphingomonas desiccabilis]